MCVSGRYAIIPHIAKSVLPKQSQLFTVKRGTPPFGSLTTMLLFLFSRVHISNVGSIIVCEFLKNPDYLLNGFRRPHPFRLTCASLPKTQPRINRGPTGSLTCHSRYRFRSICESTHCDFPRDFTPVSVYQ